MTTYHIYFRNKHSNSDDYTLYRDAPNVYVHGFPGNIELPAYSNSFHTRTVPTHRAWPIDINDVPYAFCGVSQNQEIGPGDEIVDTGHKLVKISPQGNGSTVTVYKNDNLPAFRPDSTYTADAGTFKIVAERDIPDHSRYVAGHSVTDNDGRLRPQGTFEVQAGGEYYVKPNAKFYLGQFASHPGALIDYLGPVAEIDFGKSPSLSNAIVTHLPSGDYEVKIVGEAAYAMETAAAESTNSVSNVQLTQLKHQAKLMSSLIDAALGLSPDVIREYICTAKWMNNPSPRDQVEIASQLSLRMKGFGYYVKLPSLQPILTLPVTSPHPKDLEVVLGHWLLSIALLTPPYGKYLTSPKVRESGSGTESASQSGSFESQDVSPVPRPQWRCSVQWLEGAPPYTRSEIIVSLISSMTKRRYMFTGKTDTEEKLSIDFYHARPTDQKTAQAHWEASYKEIPPFMNMFVTNPQVEPLFHTQAQTNGVKPSEAPLDIIPPPMTNYIGWLQWLEGPNQGAKDDIIKQLIAELERRGNFDCRPTDLPALDGLMITFSHMQPTSLEQARADWLAAFNSITGLQRMFIFNPLCARNNLVKKNSTLPQSSYIGSLRWLEGPNKETRESIVGQLKTSLRGRQNDPAEAIDFEDFVALPFSHDDPSSLDQAKQDWIAAYGSVNEFQRMCISDPRCEKDDVVTTNALILPPGRYLGRLGWLEGPNQTTKDDIIRQLKASLESSQNTPENDKISDSGDLLFIPFSHQFPSSLDQARADWLAAYQSIKGNQRMFITGPDCEADGPVSNNPPPAANGTAAAGPEATEAADTVGPAPPPVFSSQTVTESIEEKKRRALALLQKEGLIGFGGLSV